MEIGKTPKESRQAIRQGRYAGGSAGLSPGYVQAHLVNREALAAYQARNDALLALETLKRAVRTDVEPILAMARHRAGGAIDPIAAYRASGYRQAAAHARPAVASRETSPKARLAAPFQASLATANGSTLGQVSKGASRASGRCRQRVAHPYR